jgi:hypothetical protein
MKDKGMEYEPGLRPLNKEDMIERVARAMYDASSAAACGVYDWFPNAYDTRMARAAIGAMRTPTPFMKMDGLLALVESIESRFPKIEPVADGQVLSESETARRYMTIGAVMRSSIELVAAWEAMIDAVLSSSPKGGSPK